MAADTAPFRALGDASGQLHARRIRLDRAVRGILGPVPVAVIGVVALFALEHDRDRPQPFGPVRADRLGGDPTPGVVVLDDDRMAPAVDGHPGGVQPDELPVGALAPVDVGMELVSVAAKLEPALAPIDLVVQGALKGVHDVLRIFLRLVDSGASLSNFLAILDIIPNMTEFFISVISRCNLSRSFCKFTI